MNEKFEAEPDGIDLKNLEIRLNSEDCPHGPVGVLVYYKNPETHVEYFGRLVFERIGSPLRLSKEIGLTMELSSKNAKKLLSQRSKEWVEEYRVQDLSYGRLRPVIRDIDCEQCRAIELLKRAAENPDWSVEAENFECDFKREFYDIDPNVKISVMLNTQPLEDLKKWAEERVAIRAEMDAEKAEAK